MHTAPYIFLRFSQIIDMKIKVYETEMRSRDERETCFPTRKKLK